MTRHWVEAYVDHDQVNFRMICEQPHACLETSRDERGESCAVTDFFDEMSVDLLEFPRGDLRPFGQIEVQTVWQGSGEDGECRFVPAISPAIPAGSHHPETAGGQLNWQRIATQIARYGGSYHGLTTVERDAVEAEVKDIQEQEWGTDWERRTDASDGGRHA